MTTTLTEPAPRRDAAGAARTREPVELPRRWAWLFDKFQSYSEWYVRRHFHAVRLAKASAPLPDPAEPTLVVLNHPSWWDPLACMVLSRRLFPTCEHYGAINAAAVNQYGFLRHIGFVPVDTASLRGGGEFLRTGRAILSRPGRTYWVTAQGRFTDVRERPLGLRSGVGHLAARMARGVVLPVAFEYTFWTERTPEMLIRVGTPLRVADHPGLGGREWTAHIEQALTDTLGGLNADAIGRDAGRFETLLSGKTGVGGVYDLWRRLKAWSRGRRFDPSHEAGMRESGR